MLLRRRRRVGTFFGVSSLAISLVYAPPKRSEPVFHAFDLPSLNGKHLRERPLIERERQLRSIVPKRVHARPNISKVPVLVLPTFVLNFLRRSRFEKTGVFLRAPVYRSRFRLIWTNAFLFLSPLALNASIIFTLGNSPSNDVNILLNSGATGTTVTGSPNTFPGVIVDFTSTQSLSVPSSGQARVAADPEGTPLTNLTISCEQLDLR